MDAGHRGVIFDKLNGVSDVVKGEGTHFLVPFMQTPIIFDVRSKPRSIPVMTPSKGAFPVVSHSFLRPRGHFPWPTSLPQTCRT